MGGVWEVTKPTKRIKWDEQLHEQGYYVANGNNV